VAVPILKQGPFLIASIQAALTDTDVIRLQDDMDSFVSRSLRGIAHIRGCAARRR
jgi:rsbT antagonist protein RsbS